jgi:hypothetical protein
MRPEPSPARYRAEGRAPIEAQNVMTATFPILGFYGQAFVVSLVIAWGVIFGWYMNRRRP